jgi:cytochrome c553
LLVALEDAVLGFSKVRATGRLAMTLKGSVRLSYALLIGVVATSAPSQEAPPGAVACTGCHGLFDGAPYPIQQLPPDEITAALAGFRDGSREGTLMPRIAVAFSDEESRDIAEWFASQGDTQ